MSIDSVVVFCNKKSEMIFDCYLSLCLCKEDVYK